jgi:LytS/YehU family sensor histidine kinase
VYKQVENKIANLISYLLIFLFLSFILANIWFVEIVIFDKIIASLGYQVSNITFRYYAWEISQGLVIIFSWSATYLLIKTWMESYKNKVSLDKATLSAENAQLKFLQHQLNPHFLFNSLNNINSFVQRKPDKASFAIIKLSEIMRYMLYEAKESTVLLEKEINYMNSFLELQKLRFKNEQFVDFQIKGNIHNVFVPPLLFISFIENAFKYGSILEDKRISISIEVTDIQIEFKCSNKINSVVVNRNDEEGGIGILNTKKRLELLYPGKHTLNIKKEKDSFNVILKIIRDEN